MIKKTVFQISILLFSIGMIGAISLNVSAEENYEPVWSSNFENVSLTDGKVTEVIPETGLANIVDSGSDGYEMTVVKSFNGTKALRINNDDYLSVFDQDGQAPVTGEDSGVTVNYWVKVYSGTTSWGFFDIKDGVTETNNKRFYFGVINNMNNLSWESQSGERTALNGDADLSDWHMITVTYGENGSYSYIDGKEFLSNTDPFPNGGMEDILGGAPSAYIGYASAWDEHADIAIDEYSIYDAQLNPEQIAALYEQSLPNDDPQIVWSSNFENVSLIDGKVTEVIPETGLANIVDSGSDGYEMTVVKSFNGTKALRINNDDYLSVFDQDGQAPVTGEDSGVTVNYWVKVYSGTTSWGFFDIKDGVTETNNKRFYFGIINNMHNLSWESQSGERTALNGDADLSDWHMVTVTYGENGSYSYIDGKEFLSNTDPFPNGGMEDILGGAPSAYIGYASAWDEHADIAIDEYSIYDAQLDPEQIAALYDSNTAFNSGVYLDGAAAESFDAATGSALGDADGGEHTITVYTDSNTSQNTWIQDRAVKLNISNGDGGARVTQQSSNPMFRIGASGSELNIGKNDLTETDEITSLTLDGGSRGRLIDMQSQDSTANIYNGTILENGKESRGGGIDNKLGTVNIYGGIIRNNTATGISGGGGVDAIGKGVINIYGGLITNNVSETQRGGGASVTENGTLRMSGGTISGNEGYDVYVGNNNFYMSGDAYAGNIYLAGDSYINVGGDLNPDHGHGIIKLENYSDGKTVARYADGISPNVSDFFVMSNAEQAYELAVDGQDLVLVPCERTYVETLYETACAYPTIEDGAEYIRDELSIANSDGLTENVVLPSASEEEDGFSLSWQTNDPGVITSDGFITRPERGKTSAVMTAVIVFKGIELTRDITVTVNGLDPIDYSFNIASEKDVDLNKDMYGLFFEDINFAADGGLYAEMIENRSFEALKINSGFTTEPNYLSEWSGDGSLIIRDSGGLNDNNPHYLEFTGKSFSNSAYDGVYMEEGKTYNVSFWAKSNDYTGDISVSAGDNSVTVVNGNLSNEWTKYEAALVASENVSKTPFTINLSEEGTVCFDMISVIPDDATYGIFRKDLVEALKALDPGFLRFPGGCIVEGGTIDNYYNWKDTVGKVEERKQNWNKWGSYGGNAENYGQTYGIGYYEYFLLCEYLDCAPMPILNVGLACQNIYPTLGSQMYPIDSAEFKELVQDALDLVEFANGTDFENSEWAALRRDMGHPEPFNLTMIGIGNEQWNTSESKYYERYSIFEQAIHEKYPDMHLIGCCMRDSSSVWNWVTEEGAENNSYMYALDEHRYDSAEWFYENNDYFDSYDRDTNTKLFFGEFAARTSIRGNRPNSLDSALAVASFMTGIERNGDLVKMASYAPLFARNSYTQWTPSMIYFDGANYYGSPEYYVQKLFGNNMGDYTLKSELVKEGVSDDVYQTVSYDDATGDIIIKIVNAGTSEKITDFNIQGFNIKDDTDASLSILTGDSLTSLNSIADPENVCIESNAIKVSDSFRYNIPAISALVIRIPVAEPEIIDDIVKENGVIVSVDLNVPDDVSGTLYIAQYNENGSLYSLDLFKVDSETNTVETNVALETDSAAIMLWDDALKPITNKKLFN